MWQFLAGFAVGAIVFRFGPYLFWTMVEIYETRR